MDAWALAAARSADWLPRQGVAVRHQTYLPVLRARVSVIVDRVGRAYRRLLARGCLLPSLHRATTIGCLAGSGLAFLASGLSRRVDSPLSQRLA